MKRSTRKHGVIETVSSNQGKVHSRTRDVLSAIGVASLLGCSSGHAARVEETNANLCAFFTRNGEIAHLWVRPNGVGSYPEIEIGMHLHEGKALVVPIFFTSLMGGGDELPQWRKEWGGYATAYWPGTLFNADTGTVVLDTIGPERLAGHFMVSGFAQSVRQWSQSRVSLSGVFSASRDTAFEREIYGKASDTNKRPISNRCTLPPA